MEEEFSPTETLRGMEVAAGHLEEAEEVLWSLSSNASSPEVADELDSVLEDLWELQSKTSGVKENIKDNHTEFEWQTYPRVKLADQPQL